MDQINEAIDEALGAARSEVRALSCTAEVQKAASRHAAAKEKKLRRVFSTSLKEYDKVFADLLDTYFKTNRQLVEKNGKLYERIEDLRYSGASQKGDREK